MDIEGVARPAQQEARRRQYMHDDYAKRFCIEQGGVVAQWSVSGKREDGPWSG